jgi:hypothetical protein
MITYTNKFKSDNVDSSSLLQQLGTSSANTTCLQLVNRFVATCLQIGSNLCIFTCVSLFIAEVMELRCFQTVYTRKNAQVVTDLQTSCEKVVVKPISVGVHTACSQLLRQVWNKLLSPCYTKLMGVTD